MIFLVACSESVHFESYQEITVNKNYDLAEQTFEEVILSSSEKDELFSLINELKIKKETRLVLDIKGYLYQIIIDQNVINIVNGEYCYYNNQLYKMTKGAEKLILFLTEK